MTPKLTDSRPEKRWVGRSFGAAASSYDGVAALQRSVGQALLSRWPERLGSLGAILDVGTGTGHFAAELSARYPQSRLIALDISEGMLRVARDRLGAGEAGACVCADAEALPLADGSVDLIFSNLAIQWCDDTRQAFREFFRVLKPAGTVIFSTFGGATLAELRRAWATVDRYSHVNEFAGVRELGMALREAGFTRVCLETERRSVEYADVGALMRELKSLGARNLTAGRPRHLTGKRSLQRMIEAYEAQMPAGVVRASFEIVVGWVRKP